MKVRAGDLIRTRAANGRPWFYGVVVRQDNSGLIHLRDDAGRRRELTSVDAQWLHDNGNLQTKAPTRSRHHDTSWRCGR